jgi:branched-chain amino acid transport system permease protein
MVGGYIALFTLMAGINPALAVTMAIVGCVFLASAIYMSAYRPLGNAPRISLLITAIGVSMLLQNLAQLFFSARAHSFPASSLMPLINYNIGGVNISLTSIVTICVAVVSMAGLTFLVQKTKIGKAMRAVSEDQDAAQLMGISLNTTISFTFGIGSALAAVASILYISSYSQISPTMGSMLGIKAFVAAVLGGIGSIPGAVMGGLLIGVMESLTKGYISSRLADAVVFSILIIVLLIRPSGILGVRSNEKV